MFYFPEWKAQDIDRSLRTILLLRSQETSCKPELYIRRSQYSTSIITNRFNKQERIDKMKQQNVEENIYHDNNDAIKHAFLIKSRMNGN
jgi:hypothetical protein